MPSERVFDFPADCNTLTGSLNLWYEYINYLTLIAVSRSVTLWRSLFLYSHLKHLTATPKQRIVTPSITRTDSHILWNGVPKKVAFISWMPCVMGKNCTIFCIVFGITSNGKVAPEKISIGKYKIQAITLAVLAFLATPPTIIPMLKVEIIVKSQLPIKAIHDPCISTFQNSIATGITVARETAE